MISSSATGNQWFLNGQPIAGATSQTFVPNIIGNYSVQVTDPVTGCGSLISKAVYVNKKWLLSPVTPIMPVDKN